MCVRLRLSSGMVVFCDDSLAAPRMVEGKGLGVVGVVMPSCGSISSIVLGMWTMLTGRKEVIEGGEEPAAGSLSFQREGASTTRLGSFAIRIVTSWLSRYKAAQG